MINCELTLADISAFLKRLEIGKTGTAFIIERDGNLVANSIGLDCMKDGTGRLPATEAPDPRIAAAAVRQLYGPVRLADSINGMRVRTAELDGRADADGRLVLPQPAQPRLADRDARAGFGFPRRRAAQPPPQHDARRARGARGAGPGARHGAVAGQADPRGRRPRAARGRRRPGGPDRSHGQPGDDAAVHGT